MSTETPALFEITDPTEAPTYGDGPIARWCQKHLHEARDEVFVRLTMQTIITQSVMMIALFAVIRYELAPWWAAGAVYLALWGWFTPPVILMLHNTMHRPFIKSPKLLNRAHPFVMSFFHGIPTGYQDHHLGMHHAEDNMGDDLSSTIAFQRDSFLHFLAYFLRFFFLAVIELPMYLSRRRRYKMARRAVLGELSHNAVIVGMMLIDWRFGLVAFLLPWAIVRFMMMTGNWGQHAFVNTDRKNNGISNSVTCINTVYNRRAFNDGYHIGHHMKASRHWTEMPADFLANRELYAKEGAIVFEGIDFFMVSVLLWTGQWKYLAKRFVRLNGQPRSDEDVIAMLKSRVKPVRVWQAESIGVTT
jgi:fatty acid desaturase